ncbi:MAG: hypothetical protein K1W38_17760 [Lachnospiraceae bacterium]
MKNQIIKKIMAYLLVGAMVITTPMTASATELENAYSTGVDKDTGNTSGSNTNTNTNTKTQSTDLPEVIEKYNLNITGIMLDKEALSFNEVDAEGHPVSEALQARVLFDDYDPSGEPMEWASLGYDEKKDIEKQIHWYSDDNDVAKVVWAKSNDKDDKEGNNTGNLKALVKPKGVGQTNVYAWIEADGKQYVNNPDRPTPGDYIATAVVTVTEKITSIKFEKPEDFYFFEKRTYDLKEYTNLETSAKTSIPASSKGAETLIYSLEGTAPKGCTVTLTEDGILTVKKAKRGMSIEFNAIATKSKTSDNEFVKLSNEKITFGDAIHATHVTIKENGTAVKSRILDLGDVNNAETEVTVTLEKKKGKTVEKTVDVTTPAKERNSGENITDVVTWTSKNSKIADVVPVTVKDENGNVVTKDDLSRLVVAKGVGSTTITATASSGKKSTLKVTVDATPSGLKIVDINEETSGKTYTGKRTTLTAVLTAKDKNGNEFELPLGKAKIKWQSSNKKLAPISAKKDVGTVKPANLLKQNAQVNDEASVTITATVSGKDSNKKTYDVPKAEYTLKITQSSISDISISKKANSTDSNEINNGFKTLVQTGSTNKKGNDTAYIGNDVDYVASPKEIEFADAIGWTISGAAATIDDNGKLTPVKAGKATISANYVTILPNGKAKLNKKTVAVKVVQNATSIAFAKDQTVKNPSPKGKAQTVTLKVKSIEPKKATCNVASWKTLAYIIKKDGDTYTPYTIEDKSVEPKKTGNNITKCTNNSVTVKIPGDAQAGSVIKVGAYTNGGVVAYAYIYVTGKTTRVKVDTPKTEFRLGETASIGKVMVELGKDENKKIIENEAAFKNALFGNGGTQGDTTAYITEPVTYSVDKNSAKFIKVDQNGNVTGIQKTGKKTATVTIKTVSGKSAKVKIKVN